MGCSIYDWVHRFFVSEDPATLRSCVLKDEGLALRLAAYHVLKMMEISNDVGISNHSRCSVSSDASEIPGESLSNHVCLSCLVFIETELPVSLHPLHPKASGSQEPPIHIARSVRSSMVFGQLSLVWPVDP